MDASLTPTRRPHDYRRQAAHRRRRAQEAALHGRHDPRASASARPPRRSPRKNTCKACAYGMGGQNGGMTNELGEFPSVCNKSVQAQSTDIQPPIPQRGCSLHTHRAISPQLSGRADGAARAPQHPAVHRRAGSDRFEPVEWDFAYRPRRRQRLAESPSPTAASSIPPAAPRTRPASCSSLLARAYGTNNVNNCSYYCHQATSEGLATTIGKGTSTVELEDLTGADSDLRHRRQSVLQPPALHPHAQGIAATGAATSSSSTRRASRGS
jgi:anaerobic selenocysteine-containing dehydrogenase